MTISVEALSKFDFVLLIEAFSSDSSQECANLVFVFVVLGIILLGAAFGYLLVRKYIIYEDGEVDVGVAQFIKWSMCIVAVTCIILSTKDTPLAMVTVRSCLALYNVVIRMKWRYHQAQSYSGRKNPWAKSKRRTPKHGQSKFLILPDVSQDSRPKQVFKERIGGFHRGINKAIDCEIDNADRIKHVPEDTSDGGQEASHFHIEATQSEVSNPTPHGGPRTKIDWSLNEARSLSQCGAALVDLLGLLLLVNLKRNLPHNVTGENSEDVNGNGNADMAERRQLASVSTALLLAVGIGIFDGIGGFLLGRTLSVLTTTTLATSMAARQGPIAMAAHQICLQVWLAVSLITDALAASGQRNNATPLPETSDLELFTLDVDAQTFATPNRKVRVFFAYNNDVYGNWDTLEVKPKARGVDTRDELLKFYKENYSANLMNLVIYTKESLDKIESSVLSKFHEIRNIGRIHPTFPGQPCTSEHLQIIVKTVPIKRSHKLRITWPITPGIHHYMEGPSRYLGHLIGHEGEGSLFYILKKLGWATSLSAGESDWTMEFSFFKVVIELSDAGHGQCFF
ncbi:hypothetical protein L2E82_06394 [Cichorium intybus]|uniref:Uncharacterized protein n=1 Tax=Cichorium intybus TaxID=13427 RepID=A0ACB9HAD0_CICIN|nr:hypothetical protein L2E82_06394 [Cichorium intybus]